MAYASSLLDILQAATQYNIYRYISQDRSLQHNVVFHIKMSNSYVTGAPAVFSYRVMTLVRAV